MQTVQAEVTIAIEELRIFDQTPTCANAEAPGTEEQSEPERPRKKRE